MPSHKAPHTVSQRKLPIAPSAAVALAGLQALKLESKLGRAAQSWELIREDVLAMTVHRAPRDRRAAVRRLLKDPRITALISDGLAMAVHQASPSTRAKLRRLLNSLGE